MDTTSCPECGAVAEVQWRDVLESTDGPVEHAKVLCLHRHWFLLPVASLVRPPAPQPDGSVAGLTARAVHSRPRPR
ncbi:hypothetical protein [uncultured Serinicoccus sp.]|uniref:hypothetical protein n=1 Tax=uncultured Serinicoccus sp. TaxID=735514 RepID=UPI0026032435|nr:hypothetical protein [uncultured Serinicoccus sp.]